ncbi:MAG: sulfite exporter TauE/SafE family protein [Chloroflexi bacterium]|nr:sulfite exporter TauE/SafE family protein [Chloroflexota bacterium]
MAEVLSTWWVLPVSVAIATVALSSGISGALFFSPFFLLAVGLEPARAIGAGLMTELFGTGFGSYSYVRQGVIDYRTARFLLIASVPAGMVGAWLANLLKAATLQAVFGVTLVILAIILLYHTTQQNKSAAGPVLGQDTKATVIRSRDGAVYTYRVCNRVIGVPLAGIGAALTGLISAGLPEITTTQLILRCRIPPRVAVATAIFVLTITVFFAVGIHALSAKPAWHVIAWSIPGVIIGAQIGPRLQGRVSPLVAERVLGGLFMAVGLLVIALRLGWLEAW